MLGVLTSAGVPLLLGARSGQSSKRVNVHTSKLRPVNGSVSVCLYVWCPPPDSCVQPETQAPLGLLYMPFFPRVRNPAAVILSVFLYSFKPGARVE